MEKAIQLLTRLSEAHGCSGYEEQIRRIFKEELKSTISTVKSGCIIATSKGASPVPVVMLEAHMDEVGFAVQSIHANGFIKFIPLGGWWGHTLLSQRVRILTTNQTEVIGVIATKPPHFLDPEESKKVVKIEEMYVDVGASSRKEVTEDLGINLGDSIVPDSKCTMINNSRYILGKAFDNRAGMALAIQATLKLRKMNHPNTVCTVGSVQEEVGVRGVKTAVAKINPDAAIVLEGTPADDTPGISPEEIRQGVLGNGPQIRLMDSSAILNRPFSDFVSRVASDQGISCQIAVRRSGGTDAKSIQWHGTGIPTVVIGVPVRYIHTHNSIIHVEDYLNTLKLIVEIIKKLDRKQVQQFT